MKFESLTDKLTGIRTTCNHNKTTTKLVKSNNITLIGNSTSREGKSIIKEGKKERQKRDEKEKIERKKKIES